MKIDKSAFSFKSYWVNKSVISISCRDVDEAKLSIQIKPSGIKKKNSFLLNLMILVNDDNENLKIEVSAEATFNFKNSLSMSELDDFFYLNAPAIFFPYVRSYISTLTTQSGIGPIILPTLNLTSLKDELKKNTSEED